LLILLSPLLPIQLGILAPIAKDEIDSIPCECMSYVEAPFREDLKRFTFPPLDRVINRDGKELLEHASLPTTEMMSCMDEMVDSMDLMEAAEDEDGQPTSWFKCVESFNPAIHAIKEAVSWRVFHPDDTVLPQPHKEVIKYLEMPDTIKERSDSLGKRCREIFDLKSFYPIDKKVARRQAEDRARERGDDDANGEIKEINLEGVMDDEVAAEAAEAAEARLAQDDSDTEEEIEAIRPSRPAQVKKEEPTSQRQGSEMTLDVSNAIEDFEKQLADPKCRVEEVIESMGNAIASKVRNSFASNSYSEARDMLKSMRKGAIEYEEADRFNTFLRTFKANVLDKTLPRSRSDFWDTRIRGREDLSLITDKESIGDEDLGVDDGQAAEFINL
jgi:ATP-dependent DNA helicase 2 subunit 2